MKIVTTLTIATTLLLTATACHTTKSVKKAFPNTPESESVVTTPTSIQRSSKMFFTFTQKGNRISSKGDLRIANDSTIQISLQPFAGMEIARIGVTPQRMIIIDRYNKQFSQANWHGLNALAPGIDFKTFFTKVIDITNQPGSAPKTVEFNKLSVAIGCESTDKNAEVIINLQPGNNYQEISINDLIQQLIQQ